MQFSFEPALTRPDGQSVHTPAPAAEMVPAGQSIALCPLDETHSLPVGHCWQLPCPGVSWNCPRGHWLHAMDPAVENLPIGQSTGAAAGSLHWEPAGQSVQVLLRTVLEYLPEAQAVQAASPSAEYFPATQSMAF